MDQGPRNEENESLAMEEERRIQELLKQEESKHRKAAMEWERWILHSANVALLTSDNLVQDWYARMLPYPLIKYKYLQTKEQILKEVRVLLNEGNIADAETKRKIVESQPRWRREWLEKYPQYLVHLVRAPEQIRDDVSICPIPGIRSWVAHVVAIKDKPTWLNYPGLPPPTNRAMGR